MPELTMGSLFDGIGGFPLAAVRNGITPLWASEIEPFPIEVTKTHVPDMVHVGDIQRSMARTCRPWTSSAGAARARISAWPEQELVSPVRVPACLWSRSAS